MHLNVNDQIEVYLLLWIKKMFAISTLKKQIVSSLIIHSSRVENWNSPQKNITYLEICKKIFT